MADTVLLLDSNSLMHRAYHAMPNLKTTTGVYTGAIFGFLNLTLKLVKDLKPTHIAAAFDLKGPTFRHEMYDGYKATRKPMDEELRLQVEPLKQLISEMGIKIVSMQGFEGDDILGTLSRRFANSNCVIVTGDRDSFQLVAPNTKIYWTKKGVSDIEVYDVQRLAEEGFTPSAFVDFKALRGDPSDNIPGVAGVGEKTARQLLEKYGSLDEVLSHADEIPGKVGKQLTDGRDMALLSRRLAEIKCDVPVECTLDELKFTPVYSSEVRRHLQELELNILVSRLTFAEEEAPRRALSKEVVAISDAASLANAAEGDRAAVYIDSDIYVAFSKDKEYKLSCAQNLFDEGMSFDEAIAAVRDVVRDRTLVCYDLKQLKKLYDIEGRDSFDVMIAAHLARESAPIKNVGQVLGTDGFDTGACELLAEADNLLEQLKNKGLEKLFFEVEQPLASVLCKMETRGVAVSAEILDSLEKKYGKLIEQLQKQIFEEAGTSFNIASPKQLGEVLFERMGLPHGKGTKTGYSVSEDVLSKLTGYPIVRDILAYRHYAKLQSTYVVGLKPLIRGGRIYTEYNQCVTTTGRLSSTNPNLQNLPTRSEEAKDIKSAFLPSEGNVLVSADYSQIELRLLAHMSGDEQLIDAFNRNDDIHAITASQIFGVPVDSVTADQRREAKAVNFGIIYGISGFGLAENLSIPQYKAKEFIANYFATHPKVRQYMDGCVEDARQRGYALTLLGRRRNLSDLRASNAMVRAAAERMAMNTPLQGSAADIIKLAMLAVEKRLEGKKSKMILQIHDELIIDAAPDEVEFVKQTLSEEMQNAYKLKVPLIAKATEGKDWSALK